MYGNYVQGSTDSGTNAYNLLVSGAPSGYTSSGLMIGGDTSTAYGFKIQKDAGNNALLDMRADMSNKMSLRYKDQSSGTVSSMLDLMNDSSLKGTGYGAVVNGRVNASSYFVGSVDTRAPVNTGVYMGTDGNVGYFNINKGTGSGGFSFNTYNADGSLLQRNLNLLASGVVQASYYTSTGNVADTEAVAIAGLDASGNLVRNYASNARFRALESRMTVVEGELTGDVPSKVNEIVTRLNGLNFFSQNIASIAVFTPASPGNNIGGASVNYLVTPSNWFTTMNLVQATNRNNQFTPTVTGSGASTVYQLTSGLINSTGNGFSMNQRIQDYASFTASFSFSVVQQNGNPGDTLAFYCGLNAPGQGINGMAWYGDFLPGMTVAYKVYPADYGTDGTGTYMAISQPTCLGAGSCVPEPGINPPGNGQYNNTADGAPWVNNTNMIQAVITYNNSTTNTWSVSLNGKPVVSYSNPRHTGWLGVSGPYWGICAGTGGAFSAFSLTNVSLSYT